MIRIRNMGRLKAKLATMSAATERKVGRSVFAAAQILLNEVFRLVRETAKSGRTYKRGKRTHQASAPGEPPAQDTGQLMQNTNVRRVSPRQADVYSRAEHAAYLEYGTERMAARPFMRPAVDKKRKEIREKLIADIRAALR